MSDVEEGPTLDAAVVIVSVLFGLLGLALVILAVFTIFFCWHKKHIAKHVDATHFLIRKKENHAAYGRNDAGHAAGPSNACVASRLPRRRLAPCVFLALSLALPLALFLPSASRRVAR